jgi:hypothetical protein
MKKLSKRLSISAETIRDLSSSELTQAGGASGDYCAIMVIPRPTTTRSLIVSGCVAPTLGCGGSGGGGSLAC